MKRGLFFSLVLILVASPVHAQTFAGRSGGDVFILPPYRLCLGEDNGSNVCIKQTAANIATILGSLVDVNGNSLTNGINGVKTTNTFANSSQADFYCITSVNPIIGSPCTPGIPPDTLTCAGYTIAGGVSGTVGDRGKKKRCIDTVAGTVTLPAAGSGVSPGSTGFGSKFFFRLINDGTAVVTLAATGGIAVGNTASVTSYALQPGSYLDINSNDTNWFGDLVGPGTVSSAQWINIRNYGAVGDGVTDSRAAIQAAIAAIPAGGAYLYFPAGVYMTSCRSTDSFALNLPSNTTLVGDGRGQTVIRRLANQLSFCRLINTAATVSKVQVKHLTLDGNKPNEAPASCTDSTDCTQQHLFFVNGSTDVSVDDVEFTNTWGDGFYWFGGGAAAGAIRPKVTNSYFNTIFRVGVHAQSFTDGTIVGNTFVSSQNNNHVKAELDNTGESGSGLTISGNVFDGNSTSNGVVISGFSPTCSGVDGAITNGTATFTAATGCFVAASVGDTITVNGAGVAGANLTTTISAFTSLTQVTLATNASTTVTNAVWTDNGSTIQNITVTGNTFRNLALGVGIGIHSTNWTISGNLVDNSNQCIATTNYSTLYGFFDHRNVVIADNTCSNELQSGVVLGVVELDNITDFKVSSLTITGPWTIGLLVQQSQRGSVDKTNVTSSSSAATIFGVDLFRARSVSVYYTRATAQNTTSTMKATLFGDDATVGSSGYEVLDSKAFGGAAQVNVDTGGLVCTNCLLALALPSVLGTNATQTIPGTVASGTAAMTTAAITGPNCGATVTVAATNVLTTDVIVFNDNAAPAATTNGPLVIKAWPTAGNVNFAYCVQSGTLTPAAATLNWKVQR